MERPHVPILSAPTKNNEQQQQQHRYGSTTVSPAEISNGGQRYRYESLSEATPFLEAAKKHGSDLSPRLNSRIIAATAATHSERSVLPPEVDLHDDAESSLYFHGAAAAGEGHATILNEIANVAKNLIGGGVLSLSGGIAIYADDPRAAVSATIWILSMGIFLGYFAVLIAKVCSYTHAATYRECWQRTMGEHGGLAVSVANSLNPAMGCLAYASILSQTFQSLLETIGISVTRIESLLFITLFILLPLCLLKNLYVLAPFSVFGTAGVIMTAGAMVLRCVDGSYQPPHGKYYRDIMPKFRPSFGIRNQSLSSQVLPLVCMLFQAFVMHYNCPRFYLELKSATVPRFAKVVVGSFGLSSVLYSTIAVAGFLTFGGHSDSYILNNYSAFDPVATACRLAIAFSTLLTFPLAFIGLRDGVLDIFHLDPQSQSAGNLNAWTVALLTILTVTACFVTDLGVINAITGGFLATAIVFVFPALMYRQAMLKDSNSDTRVGDDLSSKPFHRRQTESTVALVLMVIGVALGLIGAWVALQ